MAIIKLASYLPERFIYFWFRALGGFAFYILKYRREVVRSNLKSAFPDFPEEKIRSLEKSFYFHFTEVFAEFIIAYRFTKSDWEKRCKLINPELLRDELDKGQPVVLLSGHMANWEWPAHSISRLMGYPMEFLYKPIKNQKYEEIMHNLRTRHGGRAIPKDTASREIIKRKDEPRVIGFIADQIPSIGTEKRWVDFLNKETAFYVGAERIAMAIQYPAFFCDTKRIGRGRYEVTFHPVAQPPYSDQPEIIETYAGLLEKAIQNSPGDYLWSHKRWKYTREEAEAVTSA